MRKIRKGLQEPSKIPPYIFDRINAQIRQIRVSGRMWYYRLTTESYTDAYRKLMTYRINKQGPRKAVGSDRLGIGKLQFEFLKQNGLNPNNTLLDIGCGSLRGGEYFIEYLNESNYTGIDISEEAIESGKNMINDEILADKQPNFHINNNLKFDEVDEKFDYAIAQSVFTHLPESNVRECLAHLDTVLMSNGEFYATFFTSPQHSNAKNFVYTEHEIKKLASSTGWNTYVYSEEDFPHPRGQKMIRFVKKLEN